MNNLKWWKDRGNKIRDLKFFSLQATINCFSVPRCLGNLSHSYRYFALTAAATLKKSLNACPNLDFEILERFFKKGILSFSVPRFGLYSLWGSSLFSGGVGGEGGGGVCPLLPVIHVYWMTFKGDLASSFKKYRFIPQQQGLTTQQQV